MEVFTTEEMIKIMGMSRLMVSVYKMPDGELLSMGAPLTEDAQTRVTFFILERYAQQNGMTVQEYVFRVMNKHDAENERLKKAKRLA